MLSIQIPELLSVNLDQFEKKKNYENLILKFKDIKDKSIKKLRTAINELRVNIKLCYWLDNKCTKVINEQYDFELKTGVGLAYTKIHKILDHQVYLNL